MAITFAVEAKATQKMHVIFSRKVLKKFSRISFASFVIK